MTTTIELKIYEKVALETFLNRYVQDLPYVKALLNAVSIVTPTHYMIMYDERYEGESPHDLMTTLISEKIRLNNDDNVDFYDQLFDLAKSYHYPGEAKLRKLLNQPRGH